MVKANALASSRIRQVAIKLSALSARLAPELSREVLAESTKTVALCCEN